jgi:hypothetical protein
LGRTKRGVPADRPRLRFQYTLRGRGEYAEGNKTWTVGPNERFIVQHPFVTDRIRSCAGMGRRSTNGRRDLRFWNRPWRCSAPLLPGNSGVVWNFEERLFPWMLETERELHQRRYPRSERDQVRNETRRIVLCRLQIRPAPRNLPSRGQIRGDGARPNVLL